MSRPENIKVPTLAQAKRLDTLESLHHAAMALQTITRLLRINLADIDMPDGLAICGQDQYGLLLAAEHIAGDLYSEMETQRMDAIEQASQGGAQ